MNATRYINAFGVQKNKLIVSYVILLLFHGFGLWGMNSSYKSWFVNATPLNLIITIVLVFWNEEKLSKGLLVFAAIAFFTGYFSEVVGVHTQLLFGHYAYGYTLGWRVLQVPLLIGVNWFITVYASIHVVQLVLGKKLYTAGRFVFWKSFVFALLVGFITTLFDYVMEPGAIALGYWQWFPNNIIPLYNYLCWFVISALIGFVYVFMNLTPRNQIVVPLLVIQALFFIGIKIFI